MKPLKLSSRKSSQLNNDRSQRDLAKIAASLARRGKSKSLSHPSASSSERVAGLPATADIETIVVDDSSVAPFTLPQEALSFTPGPDALVKKYANGATERRIWSNCELSATEQKLLRALQEEVDKQGLCFLPSVAVLATRYLARTKGDHKAALREMQATQAWRLTYFEAGPLIVAAVVGDLRHGFVYFAGRDRSLRPQLVLRPARIPPSFAKDKAGIDRVVRAFVFCLEYMIRFMLIPGAIESLCGVVDMRGVTLHKVPVKALREVGTVLAQHYIYRASTFYVCNASASLAATSGALLRLLTERQREKLVVVQRPADMLREFAAHQLEEDLGGSRPIVKEFFPFPLPPGPFDAECRTGARGDAVPGVHQAIASAGMRGRIWDPTLSRDHNTRLDYADAAEEILTKCGLPVPPHCPTKPASSPDVILEVEITGEQLQDGSPCPAAAEAAPAEAEETHIRVWVKSAVPAVDETAVKEPRGGDLTDSAVPAVDDGSAPPGGCFCCRPRSPWPGHSRASQA